ncbi:MAG: DUF1592 domain-containing protein [Rubripirellula sp.]|nr:DUF1592 domain-containing protein [Rubripirellula sp.]
MLIVLALTSLFGSALASAAQPTGLLREYCFDCHDGVAGEGGFDLAGSLNQGDFDGTLVFENLITAKMPPSDAEQPTAAQRQVILKWLAAKQKKITPISFRRLSRHEFVHSVNDLLGVDLDLTGEIPEDRGTRDFDSDRRIGLSKEMLASYFAVADKMLEQAFPNDGFPQEQIWNTNKLKDSHQTYNIYTRDYQDGVLFSWTRANNGNSYSFFYDNFDPPTAGWYELTFEAAKVGDFKEDVSIQVHAGKYYYADDRPQPQRLLEVISLGNRVPQSHTIRAFLEPGENVSVHCYSKHTFRKSDPQQGVYIKQLLVRGPLQDWPPNSFQTVFGDLPMRGSQSQGIARELPPQVPVVSGVPLAKSGYQSNLQKIGGSLAVSSFQKGMEKEKLQDGSNQTFWHTRFEPTLAKPPHFVVLKNPRAAEINGLSYAAWSGGNGNGLVKKYSVFVSEDGRNWSDAIVTGELEVRLANEQPIQFPAPIKPRFIKFLVNDAKTVDGRSLASIGKLDVVLPINRDFSRTKVVVDSDSPESLKLVVKRFAQRAFSTQLTDDELAPYIALAQQELVGLGHSRDDKFVRAAKVGFKAVLCSPRFLLVPGEHSSPGYGQAANLARSLWLSVPDAELLAAAADCGSSELSEEEIRLQIDRMLADQRSDRMIESLCDQWLNLRSWDKVSPSLKLYPKYDDLLHHFLPLETQAYLAHLIRENMPVTQLIDSNYTFLNQRLAQHYGIDGIIGQHLRRVSFGVEVPRGGLLTMGSILKVTTDGFDTSPILRGAWVSKNIVGTPISPPPEAVKAIEPEHGTAAARTLRELIDQHKNNATCYACHKSIDPYGFALESFDATGQWRQKYCVELPHRSTFQFRLEGYFRTAGDVDSSGEVDDRRFNDVFGLKELLLTDHRRVGYNFAKKFFEYVNGYAPSLEQRLALMAMINDQPNDCRMKDVVTAVVVESMSEKTR